MHNIFFLYLVRRNIMKREDTIDYNVKVTWHAIARMYNQQASKIDITTSIGFVLLNIDSTEGTAATKIAPLMGLEARSLTRILKNMEEKELIFRKPDPLDKRSVKIFLTEEGKKKKEISRNTVKTFNNYVKDRISNEKLDIFYDVLKQITSIIEKEKIY
jgi:MarR family transcriptional regulator, organic hydroperoxide resistance regulator